MRAVPPQFSAVYAQICKTNELNNMQSDLLKCLNLLMVDSCCLHDGEEIFHHIIVITIPASWQGQFYVVFFALPPICLRGVLRTLVAVDIKFPATLLLILQCKMIASRSSAQSVWLP